MRVKGRQLVAALAGAAILGMAGTAGAQEPSSLGEFSDWAAYTYKSKNGPVCYIVSQPKKSQPDGVTRDPIFFLITHRPGEKVRNEVNTIIGYPFKKESSATVQVGSDSFELFTSGDGAWSESSARDSAIVAAMKSGQSMTVKGTSWRGTSTTDQYSLAGVSAAMQKIDSTCK
ncbi:MAG: invasion associated locus B family protein [Parvibaculaceae bacterium]